MAAIGIVYAVKSTGPSTEPCRTPRVNRTESDTVYPIRILCVLFVRKSSNQAARAVPSTPMCC